ncbi:hypothetical protein NW768_005900 [Fusarium equiseti]|uniref:2EXR domain-containing protein n=1 Tax=Fusarium equiseti TaxID=61235 RepID=A0ABQ8RD93_FUSEQ|nr:hypothetical protein NW768_005900 [Fusarium equiseti]
MSPHFLHFLDLPPEIRDRIWKFAIRSDQPGVHYFTISANESRTPSEDLPNAVIPSVRISGLTLSAPSWMVKSVNDIPSIGAKRKQAQISWFFQNPSTYMVDSGLWTACKESSMIIRNHHRLSQQQTVLRNARFSQSFSMIPEMLRFRDSDSKDRYTTIRPCRDLFVLQPDRWNFIWYGLRHYPLASRRGGEDGFVNLAIEYNPRWRETGPGLVQITQRIIEAIINMHAFPVWIIDYSIKKSHGHAYTLSGSEQNQDGIAVFYGQGCRFVQVDSSMDIVAERGNVDRHSPCSESFVEDLEAAIYKQWDHYPLRGNRHMPSPNVGLLACENY